MILNDVVCVLAITRRSQAYMQKLVKHNMLPSRCLILSDSFEADNIDCRYMRYSCPYFNPRESLWETISANHIPYKLAETKDINSEKVKEMIEQTAEKYIIYSGYGGYILKPHLFFFNKKWIHVHAGILPKYRGSTTAYYSLLQDSSLGATAIFLSEGLDEGNIITEQVFPPPDPGIDIDYIYEPFIRSCVLIKALEAYLKYGYFPERKQEGQEEDTYFIIHPVLKHIAILELESMRTKVKNEANEKNYLHAKS